MWRKVLTPTLLVISIWIVVGSVTTFYIHWLAELHTRVLNENVGTIQAVAEMQDSLLRLQALTASVDDSRRPGAAGASGGTAIRFRAGPDCRRQDGHDLRRACRRARSAAGVL